MARLTISLPEPLKTQLEERAALRKLPVSQVVCEALQTSLSSPVAGVKPPEPRLELIGGAVEIRRYLTTLVHELERVLVTVDELAMINGPLSHPPPSSLPRPPWPDSKG